METSDEICFEVLVLGAVLFGPSTAGWALPVKVKPGEIRCQCTCGAADGVKDLDYQNLELQFCRKILQVHLGRREDLEFWQIERLFGVQRPRHGVDLQTGCGKHPVA